MGTIKASEILVKNAKLKAKKLDYDQELTNLFETVKAHQSRILKLKYVDQSDLNLVVQL